jgi:hypothetical protein
MQIAPGRGAHPGRLVEPNPSRRAHSGGLVEPHAALGGIVWGFTRHEEGFKRVAQAIMRWCASAGAAARGSAPEREDSCHQLAPLAVRHQQPFFYPRQNRRCCRP